MLFCAAALTLAACTEEIRETAQVSARPSVTFEGGFANADTRVAFTDGDAATNKLVWSKDDAIGIFTISGETVNINCRADLLRSSIGAANGVFIPEESTSEDFVGLEIPSSGTDQFLIYYPYSSKTDISVDDGLIHATLSAEQTQTEVNDRQIGKNGFSYAVTSVEAAAKKVNFSLNHTLSYVRFIVSTSDYSAYMLKSVQIYDADRKAVLTGDYTFDPQNKTVSTAQTGSSTAKITVSDDAAFQAIGSGKQELYLTLLPGANLSSADMYVVVTFVNEKNETVSIPMQLNNKGTLKAATMATVDLGSVNASSNAFAWYQPVEKRNLVGGWCYGAQNTYFVQRSENADEWTPVTFEVKARGDFSQVAEPKYVGIISSGDVGNNGLIRLSDGTVAYSSKPTTEVSSTYEVTVEMAPVSKNCGSSTYGVISVYDAEYNLLWSYMINSYLQGEEPKANEYPGTGKSVMDRNLGAKRPATLDIIPAGSQTRSAYFQWGRPTPLMWSNSGQTHYKGALVTEDTDLKAALAQPFIKWGASKGDGWTSNGNWYVGEARDLWGCNNTEDAFYDPANDMGKTVYDPCPAGYRVISGDVIEYATKYGVRNEADHTDITPADQVLIKGISVLQIPLNGGNYDYWVYAGGHWGSSSSWGNRTTRNDRAAAIYWSNSPYQTNAYFLEHCYLSSGYAGADGDKDGKKTFTGNKAHGFAVRCMVDTDNR